MPVSVDVANSNTQSPARGSRYIAILISSSVLFLTATQIIHGLYISPDFLGTSQFFPYDPKEKLLQERLKDLEQSQSTLMQSTEHLDVPFARECVHVMFALSGNHSGFLSEFAISLKSVLLNAPLDSNMTIHIVADNAAHIGIWPILFSNQTQLFTFTSRNQISIKTYNVESKINGWRNMVKDSAGVVFESVHTIGAYFRLFAHEVLPKSTNHVIYMDSDVAVLVNLQEIWSYRNCSTIFQWGKTRCSGFLMMNVPIFREKFWNLIRKINDRYALSNSSLNYFKDDQMLLREVYDKYPDYVSILPDAWDTHFSEGVWRWNNEELVLKNRPEAGVIHLNGGGGSKESAFEVHAVVTDQNFDKTWGIVSRYYATYNWAW
eukprot:CAMPEP_0178739382 /NCGR_PEP_ID=MMETSP0744-20121128/4025_1 /TAXON_ID=913974 /ORGANISM="Nitzschia punctata, Strain CCMP561" /LENGTH=376 /DNA_ID=CAMNT_0020392081 /DNA_START=63 /DNA_END=1190 /DNA_ORIENTATION=-